MIYYNAQTSPPVVNVFIHIDVKMNCGFVTIDDMCIVTLCN